MDPIQFHFPNNIFQFSSSFFPLAGLEEFEQKIETIGQTPNPSNPTSSYSWLSKAAHVKEPHLGKGEDLDVKSHHRKKGSNLFSAVNDKSLGKNGTTNGGLSSESNYGPGQYKIIY